MRNDIYERIKLLKKDNIKPNFAAIAQKYDCDYRTVKKYYENPDTQPFKKPKLSKLDDFKSIINEKLEIPCTAFSIYRFILSKGYKGKYSILSEYCRNKKISESQKASIRFETLPGVQAQVDWKESLKLYNLW